MLAALDEKVEKLKEQYPDMQVQKQDYNEGNDSPFILAFVTPLMKRVHSMVRVDIYRIYTSAFVFCNKSFTSCLPIVCSKLNCNKFDGINRQTF